MRHKVNDLKYTALFVVSGSIKKLVSIDCVNVYFFQLIVSARKISFMNLICYLPSRIDFTEAIICLHSTFFSIDFARWKSVGGYPSLLYRD